MKTYILVFLSFWVLEACTAKRTVMETEPINTAAPLENTTFFTKITAPLSFNELKINSRIEISTDQFIPPLSATIYIENGQKVWLNLSAFLLNVGRGLATKEGIKGYEKWNKTYIDSDFSYLNQLLHVDFIDYPVVQNLLLGRTIIPVNAKNYTLTQNAQGFSLVSNQDQVLESNGKTTFYAVSLDYDQNANLTSLYLVNSSTQQSLEINYSDWVSVDGLEVPKNVKITIKGNKNSQILIENTNFAFIRMDTPYSVPSNYTKTDIK